MKKIAFLSLIVLATACNMGKTNELQQKNDSLMVDIMEKDKQLNSLLTAMVEVDDNLQKIKERENLISLNMTSGELQGQALNEKINADVQLIYELMLENKEKIDNLEKKLKKEGAQNNNLKKIIDRLNAQMKEKSLEIIQLNKALEGKNIEIEGLSFKIEGLQFTVDSVQNQLTETKDELTQTTNELYTAYYILGSKKELKDQKILTSDGFLKKTKILSSDFSKDYLTQVDTRKTDTISLYTNKVKVLTNHPSESFTISEDDAENFKIIIGDKDKFWSISKYLVVQIN